MCIRLFSSDGAANAGTAKGLASGAQPPEQYLVQMPPGGRGFLALLVDKLAPRE